MSALYSAGVVAVAAASLAGIVDYLRRPLPGPEDTITDATEPFGGCILGDCIYLTSCEHCDTPVCAVHGEVDDARTCVDTALTTHCQACEDEHREACLSCVAAAAGRY